ncbi:MAG TPA: tripartite tricarboxylate transporter substrate binding protein [Usitatibacter sp.]|jgi:tripartite-type tricarboxylate transporter receptor subunit TctC|nr:tripartite tricarboxylate transporter substrate binding protein [Usitatibacter sp.]
MLRRWLLLPAFLVTLLSWSPAWAQSNWPAKPIRWIVPYTPGGITDSVTRLVTHELELKLGQTIIVENRPGANSIVGAEMAARSAPDGYTIVTVIAAHAANATLYAGKLNFDPVKSFAPISLAAVAPLMVTVNPGFPAKDMKELIDYAKANPGKISFGSSGVGSATHLTMELLKQTAGIDMVHVPYKGTAPGIAAAEAGDIQVLGDVPSALMPHVRAAKLRAICIYAPKRSVGAPEVPTIVEAGGPPIEGSTWVMFLAPAGTPPAIVNRISEETAKIVNDPVMRERFVRLGIDAAGTTPAETSKYLQDEIAKWAKVIQVAGVKPEI